MNTASIIEALASLQVIARQLTAEPKGSAKSAALFLETCETTADLAHAFLTDVPQPGFAVAQEANRMWDEGRDPWAPDAAAIRQRIDTEIVRMCHPDLSRVTDWPSTRDNADRDAS